MTFRIGALALLIALLGWGGRRLMQANASGFGASQAQGPAHMPDPQSTPVLVELFTSEGCSSCPPADALLSRLSKTQPVLGANIIVLEEHVTYWDDLGWKDPFSSDAATERQRAYSRAFGGEEIYTPQMIVDGQIEFVGSSGQEALRVIDGASRTPKPGIHLSWQEKDALVVNADPTLGQLTGGTAQIVFAITENMLHSDVKRGENAGRGLEHTGVVRQLIPLDKSAGSREEFSATIPVHTAREWNRANLRAVVFAQDRRSHQVLAAAAIPFPAE
jgi:hypothetical protein